MANCSDAYGTVTLIGEWTPDMCHNLNVLKREWVYWHYSIIIDDDFSPFDLSLGFFGIGRWTFKSNLESLDEWTREEMENKPLLAAAYLALTEDMERHGSQIEFKYNDEESGNLVLYSDVVTFAAKDGHLVIEQSNEQSHDYTWENYLGFDYGGEEQLAELVDDLLAMLTADQSLHDANRERVEEWAKANTLPHATADHMGEEETAAFREAFSDIDLKRV